MNYALLLALTCHSVLVCSSKLFPQWHWERELIPQWYEGRVKADAEMPTTHLTEVLRTLKSILASFKFFVRPRLALTSYCTLDHLSPYLVFFFPYLFTSLVKWFNRKCIRGPRAAWPFARCQGQITSALFSTH